MFKKLYRALMPRIVWDAQRKSPNHEVTKYRVLVAHNDNYAIRNATIWPMVSTEHGPVMIWWRENQWHIIG